MMFTYVYDPPLFGYLHVEREIGLESMLPVDFELEELDIEFLGFELVKTSENGDDAC